MSRRLSLVFAGIAVFAMISGACARDDGLGADAAIEVMVLDGVDRFRATCIVTALDGELDLAKVTGIDVELTSEDVELLIQTTAGCSPIVAGGGGVVGGSNSGDRTPEDLFAEPTDPAGAGSASEAEAEVEARIDQLVVGGLDPIVGQCLTDAVLALPDPLDALEALDDDLRLSALLLECEADLGR